jgi:hypothetical protein
MPSIQPSTISGSLSEPITIYQATLNTEVPDKSKEPYNYGKIYKLLLKNYPDIIDYNNPKLLAESIAYQIHWNLELPIIYCKKWVYEYQYRSKYSDLYQIGNNKYNLNGTYEGSLTQVDIDKTMQELHDNVGVSSDVDSGISLESTHVNKKLSHCSSSVEFVFINVFSYILANFASSK